MNADGEAVYWDPRYEQTFYSGALPPPTGDVAQLQDIYSTSSVQLDQPYETESSTFFTSAKRSALSKNGRRRKKRRRVTWSLFVPPDDSLSMSDSIPRLSCALVALVIFVLILLYFLWGYLEDAEDVTTTETKSDLEAFEDLMFYGRDNLHQAITGRSTSSESLVSADAEDSVHSAIPIGEGREVEAPGVYNHRSDERRPKALVETSRSSPQCCDVTVFCYYSIRRNSSSHASIDEGPGCNLSNLRRLRSACPKLMLGLNVDKASFRTSMSGWAENVVHLSLTGTPAATRGGFDGFALSWREDVEYADSILNATRTITANLLRTEFTLVLFLPYPVSRRQSYSEKLQRVRAAVPAASYVVVFYPDVSMFGKSTAWPAPSDVAVRLSMDARTSDYTACYLFATASFLVHPEERCTAGKVQRTTIPAESILSAPTDWGESVTVAGYRYYTKRCNGVVATIYQTPRQAELFRDSVLSLAKASCHGTIAVWDPESPSTCINFDTK